MNNELQELTAEICETVDWPEFHRVDATQNGQVRAILERFMAKHYQYEDALVAAIPKMMQQAEKAASSSLLPVGRQTIAFTCGCFASFWDCQSALACCNKHEAPRQTIDNLLKIYEIQFVYKDGLVEVATCEVCSLPIMRTCQRGTIAGWSEWVHNEPLKPQYQKRKCYDRSTTGSTTPDARPIAGSERFDI